MKEHTYKKAFGVAVVVCLLLAATLGFDLLRSDRRTQPIEEVDPVVARGPIGTAQALASGNDAEDNSAPMLAPVQLSPQRLQAIGVTTALVELRQMDDQLRLPGNVDINEQQVSYVQTRFPGWIQKVFANATYQYVRKGQTLFTIYSPDLVSTEQEYLLAKQNQKSFSQDMHGTALKEGDWLVQAASDRLRQFAVSPGQIAKLEQGGKVEHDIEVESPVSGYITERNALPNQYVQSDTKLYTIADLSTAWVYANVAQNDVGRLKLGNSATVNVDAYPGRKFAGRIDQILPQVDPMTRTVRVRLVFANPGVVLKPGMYVNVSIDVPLGRRLVIPSSGVLQAGTRQIAFVDHGQGYLEPREVEIGPRVDDHSVVLKGLRKGERVVSSANFLVDSEAQLQAAMGSFAPPPGAGAAAAMNAPSQQIGIDLSTDPTPPHKGANTVRVKLTGVDGNAVAGAQTTVTFFMPAMPAMGMAAMRVGETLSEKGNGVYEGPLQLQTGGTWQVTVTVQRNGQTVASKQLSLSATGGM
ncbi:MAG TPA: FixH family protein [Candidatus Sulfotelmatobacter sp.]|nr:FixH family protein [Candidatus Sulfotelmatobacter sp.]